MTNLLYITNGINGPGGLERVLSIKASLLADEYNYNVNIATLNQYSQDLFYNFSSKITFHNISAQGNYIKYFNEYRKGLKNLIKKINPQIILVCDDGLKGLLLPFIIGKPCKMIYERHVSKNAELQKNNPNIFQKLIKTIKFKLMDIGAKQYDTFVVLTNGNKNEWNIKNIKVIPNPLSFYPNKVSTLKNKNVLAVGKQSFQKGYDRLLHSWKAIQDEYPDWRLNIYGTINKNQNLEILANELNISKTVTFHNPVKNIAEKYEQASIYVMSSRYEGFGMVLTEAMAYGVPCVSFDCPYGPSDIIENNINGFLVTNGDCALLSQKIKELIKNQNLRIAFGKEARISTKKYLAENIVNKWDVLFKTLLKI
ncbi:glycosyltransferase family 4 protein [Seonamhaeicola algicola]|uniref:Glycosyltransferase family 4 protein n=1 Tax=Seonamhaeicola algicola TaxID=1719036 RepID=A0A5C7ATE6_9FLAO|nr:glycosyltransferase family 4 protein [Seonamhaeicola algicola]TXE11661.1 glycosyltransferase family 4 protein [Seonamhaeicola algicola]